MECLGGFEGKYVMPTLALDVAIVENASFAPVQILDLVGVLGKTRGLRAATAAADTSAAPLHIGEIQVAPGGKVIIPLRITFFAGIANGEPWGSMSDARKMYQRIASKPASAIFTLTSRRTKPPVVFRKAKSSFGPPELPESTEYRFGAELQLSGFFVDTSGFNLDHTEPNLVTLYGGDTGNDDSTDQPDPESSCRSSGTRCRAAATSELKPRGLLPDPVRVGRSHWRMGQPRKGHSHGKRRWQREHQRDPRQPKRAAIPSG